jgi:hypothetical protein
MPRGKTSVLPSVAAAKALIAVVFTARLKPCPSYKAFFRNPFSRALRSEFVPTYSAVHKHFKMNAASRY